MAFEIPKQPYSGKITEVSIGSGTHAVTLGGQDSYPFHLFEGSAPNVQKVAMEVWDYDPSKEWPAACVEPFKDVISSPEAWAKKCVEDYGADLVVLQLKSTDPNGMDRGAEEAAEVTKKVIEALDVPVVVWGTANNRKDEEVLKKIAEKCDRANLALSPVEEGNHKGVGASALGYGQSIVASSPIDVNLAKQLNILLGNLGVSLDKILIDPTTGGLGYGLEYSYSVMERIRMAALTQEDDKLQSPIICNIGNEIWKCKEAGDRIGDFPALGDAERRAILMESVSAVCYLLSGADVVVLRHPESVRLTKSYVGLMVHGGDARDLEPISKRLDLQEPDFLALSPEPNLDFAAAEEPPKRAAKKEAPKAEAKPAEEKPAAAPKAEAKKKAEEKPAAEAEAKKKAEEKPAAEAEAKKKAEEKAAAEAETKKKAEEKAAAEAETKKKAEEKAAAEAETKKKAEEREQLRALREKRARERSRIEAEREGAEGVKRAKTPAAEQKNLVDKLIDNLARIHKRL